MGEREAKGVMRTEGDFAILREALRQALLADGWEVCPLPPCAPGQQDMHDGELGTFRRPLRSDFLATVMFWWEHESDLTLPVVMGCVGLEHGAARNLLAALTGSDVFGAALREPILTVRGTNSADLLERASELTDFANAQMPWLSELADVDTVVELLQQHRAVPIDTSMTDIDAVDDLRLEHNEGHLVPALLAGCARYDDARRVLAQYTRPGSEQAWSPREYRRFVRQLTRLLDMGSGVSLPTTPPRWPPCPAKLRPPPSFRAIVSEQVPVVKARQEAVKTVRAISKGKTRDELRTHLSREFDQRKVSMDPGAFDVTLDLLTTEQKRLGKTRIALRVIRSLQMLGSSARKRRSGGKQREVADRRPLAYVEAELESKPSWLKLPDRAAYPIWSVGDRRVAVELDPTAQAQLDRVIQESPSGGEEARFVEVWFAWADGSPGSRLSIQLGTQRVGRLDVDASEHFRPAMEAAIDRDEDPWIRAYLRKIPGDMPYVLEITLPNPHKE
jgi:hypothetical protein